MSGKVVIEVKDVSKQYNLSKIGSGTIKDDMNRWWHKVRGKDDPYLRIGETNDRTQKSDGKWVWALRDLNFEINEGDVVGIIGRNGAGKSTLLKLLSRTTTPTTGSIRMKGRVASLLEVGTGFHPDLTGRENIFLNGAILGMTKREIASKFDEIVAFSGVERYIDTPVKRYSSGMYVRLAFAVAAHLESEILIVDEVLAVGDAEFQKKALGKMQDVSKGQGRTVLFVSHNMGAVKQLCNNGILLDQGRIIAYEKTKDVLDYYTLSNKEKGSSLADTNRSGNGKCRITTIDLKTELSDKSRTVFFLGSALHINIGIRKMCNEDVNNARVIIGIYNIYDEGYLRFDTNILNSRLTFKNEQTLLSCEILEYLNIKPDRYYINIAVFENDVMVDYVRNASYFQIENADYFQIGRNIENIELSKVNYRHKWVILS